MTPNKGRKSGVLPRAFSCLKCPSSSSYRLRIKESLFRADLLGQNKGRLCCKRWDGTRVSRDGTAANGALRYLMTSFPAVRLWRALGIRSRLYV